MGAYLRDSIMGNYEPPPSMDLENIPGCPSSKRKQTTMTGDLLQLHFRASPCGPLTSPLQVDFSAQGYAVVGLERTFNSLRSVYKVAAPAPYFSPRHRKVRALDPQLSPTVRGYTESLLDTI